MSAKGLATIALILAFIMPLVGLVLGIIAVVKSGDQGGQGRTLAIVAIIVSIAFVPVILSFIGALAYFGVLSPTSMIPEKCSLGAGLVCNSYTFDNSANQIKIELQNSMGKGVMINSFTATGKGDSAGVKCVQDFSSEVWEEKAGRHVSNGGTTDIVLDCSGSAGLKSIERAKYFDLEVVWHSDDLAQDHSTKTEGSLLTK